MTALREAGNPRPLAAAFRATAAARYALGAFGVAESRLRAEVLGALGNSQPSAGSMGLAVRAFGSGPDGADVGIPRLFSDPVAAIREEDGWAVAVENHERLGPFALYENLPSATVTIAWSARGRALLHYSDERRLLVMLDPQSPDQLSGADPAVLDAHLGGLRLGPAGVGAAACLPSLLVLAERLTGIAFDPAMLDRPHLLVSRPTHLGGVRYRR